MRKALEGVIKTESQKKVLAQYSVGDGKGPRAGTEMSGWTKALLRNTQGKSRCQIIACVYIPASLGHKSVLKTGDEIQSVLLQFIALDLVCSAF